jgi:excisionase family DNA binding protein
MNRDDVAIRSATVKETFISSNDSQQVSGPRPSQRAVSFDSRDLSHNTDLRIRNDGMSRLLTVAEAAALLNVPRKWVYRRVALKSPEGMPHVKMGKYLRFRESDLRNYVERLRRN